MNSFIDKILSGNNIAAKDLLEQRIAQIVNEKMKELKIDLAEEIYGDIEEDEWFEDDLDEANIQKMGRTKLIRIRVRNGKVQRRVKKSAVKGYTYRGGKIVRMSTMERRHRKMGARRARFKRRSKMQTIIRKRNRSLRRRTSLVGQNK